MNERWVEVEDDGAGGGGPEGPEDGGRRPGRTDFEEALRRGDVAVLDDDGDYG